MLRLGVICDREFFHPFDQRVYKEALTLRDAGFTVEILTPHPRTGTRELEGLTVRCVSTTGPPGATALRLLRSALRGGYDAFHCHELDPLLYALLLRPLTRRPVVWDCHEWLVPMKRELQGPLAARLTALAQAVAAPRVNRIVTVDNRLGRRLARYAPVTVLPNYPRAADFPEYDPNEGTVPTLLYVGSLTEVRGVREMLRGFRRLRRRTAARLEVAGGFTEPSLEAWAREYDRRHGLEVVWHGPVDHRKLAPIIARAGVGLSLLQPLPRYQRAMPTKVFEYLIMGLPVLASQSPIVEALLARGDCGLAVDSTDPDAIARGMEALLTHPQRAAMGARGAALVRRHYVWEARAGVLAALHRRLQEAR